MARGLQDVFPVQHNRRRVALVGLDVQTRADMSRGLAEAGYGVDEFGAADRFMSLLTMLHMSHHGWVAYDVVVIDAEMRGMTCDRLLSDLALVDPRIATVVLCVTAEQVGVDELYADGAAVVAERSCASEDPRVLIERALRWTRIAPGRAPMM